MKDKDDRKTFINIVVKRFNVIKTNDKKNVFIKIYFYTLSLILLLIKQSLFDLKLIKIIYKINFLNNAILKY